MKNIILVVILALIGCAEHRMTYAERVIDCGETVVEAAPAPPMVVIDEVSEKLKRELTLGMLRIKEKRDFGAWFVCGERLDESAAALFAWELSSKIVENADGLSPFHIAATMYNESGFDQCALGVHPRKFAYSLGLLKPSKHSLSHSREDVLKAIENAKMKKQFAKTGYDLSLCQVLSKYTDLPYRVIMTVDGGISACMKEMKNRALVYGTSKPWVYWRGKKTEWYGDKINRWVKIMKGVGDEKNK